MESDIFSLQEAFEHVLEKKAVHIKKIKGLENKNSGSFKNMKINLNRIINLTKKDLKKWNLSYWVTI